MPITFYKTRGQIPNQSYNTAYLNMDNWDDFGYKTLFYLTFFNDVGEKFELGSVKIGFVNHPGGWTADRLEDSFELLGEGFFSLGQDADYYRSAIELLPNEIMVEIFTSLRDVAFNPRILEAASAEDVFGTSLLRSVNRSSIEHQFKRIIEGNAPLTGYDFIYKKGANDIYSGIELEFKVRPDSRPPSNIHILIGRNGVGKTTLLNNMVDALLPERGVPEETGEFFTNVDFLGEDQLGSDYFAGIVSVSFSAFDPFEPPDDQNNANNGMRYNYVGLKQHVSDGDESYWRLKDKNDLCIEFAESLKKCLSLSAKRVRWINAVNKLTTSDSNFEVMSLNELLTIYDEDPTDDKDRFSERAVSRFKRMSSGHASVLLTITKLVETVEEKTLVLIDEPESHLHPPLLSAFTRALSDLLVNRNGVAIVATHSPVVLQEVPASCVSILRRSRLEMIVDSPESETFAENLGVLTRDVFQLEVSKSGFHELLANAVFEGKSFEQIEEEYEYQLGFEGRALLRSLVVARDSDGG